MIKFFRILINFFDFFTQRKVFVKIKELLGDKFFLLIDVGAHEGEYILSSAKKFSINSIIAFEPNPKPFLKLKKKIKFLNEDIQIYNLGIGENDEKKLLNINIESSSSSINQINNKSNYYNKKFKLLSFLYPKIITDSINIEIISLDDFIFKKKIFGIDLLKIDTEGYEFSIINGLLKNINKIKVIHFEHHYDDMVVKNYKFGDIHSLLIKNNFKQYFKIKMKFRKSFEYIYYNKSLINKK